MTEVTHVAAPPPKPLLLFDGDCNFCRLWIRRWQQSTGDRIEYLPLQDARVADQFPELTRERLEKAVHLIETDGRVYRAAEAVFRSLGYGPMKRWPLRLYQRVPVVAPVAERAYRLVAEHRNVFSALTRHLWGDYVDRPSYRLVRWSFLRGLGVIYLIAFVSLWTQILGLVGHNGILPADQFIPALSQQADQQSLGLDRYRLEPTLCWFDTSDGFLQLQCAAGAALSVLVMAGISPAPCLFLLWLLYLSLATVGRTFLGFQWDNLLLEAGFLAIFFAPTRLLPSLARERPPSTTILWLIRWLLFRLMFASGCVKLLSGDKTWRDLTALNFHYETQPLPTWPAWFVHQLPEWFQKTSVVLMFGIELVVPFFIFLPRRLRLFGCWAMILFQVIIAVTGNYTFFNWLTIVLCVVLLDDAALFKCVPRRWREAFSSRLGAAAQVASPSGPWLILRRGGVAALAAVVLALTTFQTAGMFQRRLTGHSALVKFYGWIMPLRSFNNYGLFAVMTTTRLEIILEGSNDGQTWLAYEFNDKPGDLKRRPRFIAPHQPRLDWQMWFAALGTYRENPWFINFGVRLLQGSPEVLALLKHNPFPNAPPKHIRAVVYQYHFTDIDARRTEGTCWRREFKGEYCPVLTLR